jgi:hypothetical protein
MFDEFMMPHFTRLAAKLKIMSETIWMMAPAIPRE